MAVRHIEKVLIANRGEIAVRIIRTCKEMGIATVAVYSDADLHAPHVLMADEAFNIGPPPSRESYLVIDKIIDVAKRTRATAIHPGYGFLSENADFSKRVAEAGLIFVGPGPESIKTMGDKTEARKLVMKANVPIVPGTPGAIDNIEEARDFCMRHGLPILIKAAAGGGGKGMRVVHKVDDLQSAFNGATSEALSAFGDGRVYIEKYLESPRHIEFQIIADHHGNTIHLGERECSIQRRHQKVIEETPSVIVDEKLRQRMGATAVGAAKACNYHNAGTIEFLVDKNRNFYFLEMNTRLQVEHPITEMRTGVDLVALQLRVAMGERIPFEQEQVSFRGHAIECRIYAEDPSNGFLPSTGRISHLVPSQGPGIREDRGVKQGGEISVYYDPMISKLVAHGGTRNEAISRMKRSLREYEILGVKTNIPFCLFILDHPKFIEGDFDTHFIPMYFKPERLARLSDDEEAAAALVCAMMEDNSLQAQSLSSVGTYVVKDGRVGRGDSTNHAGLTKWKLQRVNNMRS
ncbi:MAG: acetyl-CoA carboxylase biotin carboxylase subunit [Ignavibacteriae bacterium]|nr:acetyl-CoA carboxylase biotin carboxylase subunit [Ignavibacteriota bacterium]